MLAAGRSLIGRDAMAHIEIEGNMLVFHSRYDPALVAALKSKIPSTDRRWDAARKVWQVAPAQAQTLVMLSQQFLGESPEIQPALLQQTVPTEEKTLVVKYIGACKDRGGGERSAYGWVNGEWSVVFPESVLRAWFNAPADPGEAATLYQTLGVKQSATPAEIKTAYRHLAKQWHPDICHEPDAAEQFRSIQAAYDILNDQSKRAKYDAGLALEASLEQSQRTSTRTQDWRPPLRCGIITAAGNNSIGRFVVSRILSWQDIVENGKVLVVSWPAGADHFIESWISV